MSDPALDGRTVLVTGGAGFIGSHLVDRLAENSAAAEIRVLDNFATGRWENLASAVRDNRVEIVEGDVRDPVMAAGACDGVDVVFHLACLGVRHSLHSPQENHEVNASGTLTLLAAARAAGVARFVYVSTSEVFGTAQQAPMGETHPTWPETVYGGSKLAGEAYARAFYRTYAFPTTVVRPFNNYGPRSHFEGDSGEVIPRTIVRALAGLPPVLFGDGEQTRDFLHVSDTARALVHLAASPRAVGATVNVGYGAEISVNRLAQLIVKEAGRADLAPVHQEARPGDVRRLWVDNRLVQSMIGFRPQVGFEDGIRELVQWFASRPERPEDMLRHIGERNWQASEMEPVR